MYEYKILDIVEGGLGTILLGSSKLPMKKINKVINECAIEGWRVNFQIIEMKRYLIFWKRESMIVTFERPKNIRNGTHSK